MLKQIFFNHKWKSFIRNDRWRRNFLSKILIGILFVFVLIVLIIFGYNIDVILFEIGYDPIETFNSFLIPYLIVDILLRFLFQSLPSTYFTPYLRFRLRHTELVNLMVLRSFWSIFNIVPWFIVIPFIIKILCKEAGFKTAIFYMAAILLLVLINNFLTILIQILTRKRKFFYLIPTCIVVIMYFLPIIEAPIKSVSIFLGTEFIELNALVFVILLSVLIFIIYILRNLLLSGFYFDEDSNRNQSRRFQLLPVYLNCFSNLGNIGKYMSLEIKLILRNKRPKQTIGIYPIFPIYLIISLFKKGQDPFLTSIMLTFTFGLLSTLYGQYIFSWESTFFEIIMTRKVNFFEYIKAKYYLMILFSFIVLIVLIPIFLLFFKDYIIPLFSMFIFTIGITNFIILFNGTFNDGRIDLNESFLFNYQGLNLNQLILPLFVFVIPLGLYYLLSLLNFFYLENIFLVVIGFVFLFFHNWWIENIIMKIFKKRKYQNLEGYRKLMN